MNVISLLTPKAQVAYLYEDCTIRQGLEKLQARGYTAIPVLSREGGYVGTVSEGDFLRYMLEQGDTSFKVKTRRSLKWVMREGFNPAVSVWVSMDELLERAKRQSFVPVVDDRGAFMGIVTRQAIMNCLTLPKQETVAKQEQPAPPRILA